MLGILYQLPIVSTAIAAQVDFAEIVASATHSIYIHEIFIGNLTEIGDAQEEQLSILFKTGSTTSGSGGNAAVTAVPQLLGATAFAGSCETLNTTKATAGTIVTHRAWQWNVRQPFQQIFTPETRIRIAPSERGTLELATTPTDSTTVQGYVIFGIY